MKRKCLQPIIIGMAILLVFALTAKIGFAQGEKALTITSIIHKSQPVKEKKVNFTVQVARIDQASKEVSKANVDDAIVYAYFKKDDKAIKKRLKYSEKGIYKGTVVLPDDGEWQVLAILQENDLVKGEQPESLETTWFVHEPKHSIWPWVVALIVIVGGVVYWLAKRKRNKVD